MTEGKGSNLLDIAEARARIEGLIEPVAGIERVALRDALDRVLARDVTASFDIPPYANSAMDGYALRGADLATSGETTLSVVGESFAGHPFAGTVAPGQCVRIMTGALIPDGADTVVMQEHTRRDGDTVHIAAGEKKGANVRGAGDDIRRGERAIAAGRLLNAADMGLLASLGVAEVDIFRRPVAAFFSTGDELKGVGQALGPGDIYDSNRYTLHAMLRRLGVQLVDLGVLPDREEAVRAALAEAGTIADLVVTSGGVSVGEADFVKRTLESLGEVHFWRIAMKPGKPMAFGRIGRAYFFGLPGNPVATMATFMLFVRPAILRLMGTVATEEIRVTACCTETLRKQAGRTEFQRGMLARGADGTWSVTTTGGQGSHMLSSMSRANCFIVMAREVTEIAAGNTVEVIPFAGLL